MLKRLQETLKRLKTQVIDMGKISPKHVFDKGLESGIHKKLSKQNNKKTSHLLKKKRTTDISPKNDTQVAIT